MILHVDMDAFYASVEERDRPELAGKPLIVGGSPDGRGVVAAANYAVRRYGVHSAMPTATALRLCPQAIVLRPRMDHYAEVSDQIRDIFFRYTPLVEPLSLDEAFLDVRGSALLFGSASDIAREIKRAVLAEIGLVASVGVAPNKFLAKIASDLEKPDGLVIIDPGRVQEFLDPLPVSRIWGVGRVTRQVLEQFGLRTIADLRQLTPDELRRRFGSQGDQFLRLAHGQDNRAVVPDREAKSISHETTFAQDVDAVDVLHAWTVELAEQVGSRLRRRGLRGRTVHLKVRYGDFHTITRAHTLPDATNATRDIYEPALEMLGQRLPDRALSVRLLGVGVSGLARSREVQQHLFDAPQQAAQSKLDKASDQIRTRFGSDALRRASGMMHHARHRPLPRPEER